MSRRPRASAGPPAELCEFDVERWAAGVAVGDPWRSTWAHEAWREARAAWVAAGGVWPQYCDEIYEATVMPEQPFFGHHAEDEAIYARLANA